jgi:uncharacterized protein YgbK (DUF1537 family)
MASSLEAGGLRVRIVVGVPESLPEGCDAVVVALKIRSVEESEAVAIALASARALRGGGVTRVFFKYSSTFDSGDTGNIGPVCDAIADFSGQLVTVVSPSFPRLGRTLYQGHLFVGSSLLDRSGLGDHPLTPRRRSSIVELLGAQTSRPVGLVTLHTVHQGSDSVKHAIAELGAQGCRYAVVDGVEDHDLDVLALTVIDQGFVTGSAGLGRAMADALGPFPPGDGGWSPPGEGYPVMLCGSCSIPTRRQIERYAQYGPTLSIGRDALDADGLIEVLSWVRENIAHGAPLVYSTPDDDGCEADTEDATRFERFFSRLASALLDAGIGRYVVAGGETSGAVIQGMGIQGLSLGPEICPGVPWMADDTGILVALKSGNFGDDNFFVTASGPDDFAR